MLNNGPLNIDIYLWNKTFGWHIYPIYNLSLPCYTWSCQCRHMYPLELALWLSEVCDKFNTLLILFSGGCGTVGDGGPKRVSPDIIYGDKRSSGIRTADINGWDKLSGEEKTHQKPWCHSSDSSLYPPCKVLLSCCWYHCWPPTTPQALALCMSIFTTFVGLYYLIPYCTPQLFLCNKIMSISPPPKWIR